MQRKIGDARAFHGWECISAETRLSIAGNADASVHDDENKINNTEEAEEGVRLPSFTTRYLAPTFCAACWAICKCCCSVGKVLPAKALISGSLPSFD